MRCGTVCRATSPGTAQRLTNAVPPSAVSRSVFCPDRWLCSFSPDLKAFLIAKFAVLLFHKLYDNPATLTDTLHKRVYQFGLSLQLCFHTSIR